MAKNRQIDTIFWRDKYIETLDKNEKLLFQYCLTAPDSNIAGIYQCSLRIIASDTGLDENSVISIFTKFGNDKKIKYWDGYVVIRNQVKRQNIKNSKVRTGILNILNDVPEKFREFINLEGTRMYLDESLRVIYDPSRDSIYSDFNSDSDFNSNSKERLSSSYFEIAEQLFFDIQELVKPPCYAKRKPDLKIWAKFIRQIHQIDKRPLDEIKLVAAWAVRNPFWRSNILSGKALRNKYNTLYLQMLSPKEKSNIRASIDPQQRVKELAEYEKRRKAK